MKQIKGSIVALITPFNEDGSINFDELGRLIDFQIEGKTDAILVLGTTSESPTMTHEEDMQIVNFTVDRVKGRVPIIASSGSNCTASVIKYSKDFQEAGVDALLNISPYYNKANFEGHCRHFEAVADAVDIPIILYNIPGRTGIGIPVEAVERLSKHKNIIGIKEASGNFGYLAKIAKFADENFAIYSGNDDMIVPLLSMGGSGVISVLSNIMPYETHKMVMDYLEGNTEEAKKAQIELLPFINNLFIEVNPIPIKAAMNMAGFNVGGYRLPLYPMEEANRAKLRATMEPLGLIDKYAK
ncbi:MAG: 4-hydroxy-tetrahydrodipicolinate synthase [Firmicutes bacterium]|nr:4-hydroxy-tetrahydrodipicolinate synthase [Bacillota bacterium]